MKGKDKDNLILNELLKNSKTPFTKLSEETGIADTTIHFRVNKLKEQDIIKKFTIEVDLDKVGLKHKALIIFKVGGHILPEHDAKNAQELLSQFKENKKIGFLALAEDKKTIVALFITDNKESFEKVLNNFKSNPNIISTKVFYLDDVLKYFISEI